MPVAVLLSRIDAAPQLVRWAGHFSRGACSLWAVGLRSGHLHGKSQSWVWRAALALLMLTGILAIALYYRPF